MKLKFLLALSLIVLTPFLVKGQIKSENQPISVDINAEGKTVKMRKAIYLALYNDLVMTPSSKSVTYNTGFSIDAEIANLGDEPFVGIVAMFIMDGNTIGRLIKGWENFTIPASTYAPVTFDTPGMPELTMGTYETAVLYSTDGNSWYYVNDGYPYATNRISFNITCGSNKLGIESLSVDTVVVQGGNLEMSLGLKNNTICPHDVVVYCYIVEESASPYKIIYSDTNFITDFQPNSSNISVCQIKNIDFSVGDDHRLSIVIHLIGVGQDIYSRYISVILEEDKYEPNNTLETAAELSANFSNNTAIVTSEGSNIHASDDVDYYKIRLSTGYDYTIMSQVHDSKNSGNDKTYTCDVEFDINTIGSFWTSKYDFQAEPISDYKGGTLIFRVTPRYGQRGGTYLLELAITRTPNGEPAVNDFSENNKVKIYPNPVTDFAEIAFSETSEIDRINLFDILGRLIKTIPVTSQTMQIDMRDCPSGVYVLQMKTDKSTAGQRKILKQ